MINESAENYLHREDFAYHHAELMESCMYCLSIVAAILSPLAVLEVMCIGTAVMRTSQRKVAELSCDCVELKYQSEVPTIGVEKSRCQW